MSSVDNSGGSISEAEYNDLRADVVALRSTVAALMTELKTFRLWKEAGGDI
jgi:outer membrane murein-binding lipoprotein Lpp